jgi:hypothetical protein
MSNSPPAHHHEVPFRQKFKREPKSETSAPKRQRTAPEAADEASDDTQTDGVAADDVGGGTDHPAPKGHDTHAAVEYVRVTLQDMTPPQRRAAITEMPAAVRNELMTYMSSQEPSPARADTARDSEKSTPKQSKSWSRGTCVRTLKHIHKTSYQAQLRIRHLRMETRAQADVDSAISFQMVLVHIRHALEAAGDEAWKDPTYFCQVFRSVLESTGISQEELGLRVFIFMRAEEWIGRFATITSPMMSLTDAVAAHSRLSLARQTSWTQLRAEWALLMQKTQHAQAKRTTLAQAEALAQRARQAFLQCRLNRAVKMALRVISLRRQLEQRAFKLQAMLQQRSAKDKRAAAAAQNRAVRKQIKEWAARRWWYARADLTMEDLMQGPPLHL